MRTGSLRVASGAVLATVLAALTQAADYGSTRNGSFDEPGAHKPTDQAVLDARKAGWKLPADLVWPAHWGPNANTGNGSLEYLPRGGFKGSPAVRLDGGGHIASYFGRPEPGRPYVAVVRTRGEGDLWFGAYQYSERGFLGSTGFVVRKIGTKAWSEYRGLFLNDKPEVTSINLAIGASGPIEIDEVQLVPADPVDAEITRELVQLYGTGVLVEGLETEAVRADATFARRLKEYQEAVESFRKNAATRNKGLADSIEKRVRDLGPYVNTPGQATVLAPSYNEMLALTRALRRLAGQAAGPAGGGRPEPAVVTALKYRPGVRSPRAGRATITDVRSNKVRYDENEKAVTRATLVNRGPQSQAGTLVARMHLDLNAVRDLAAAPLTIGPGETRTWDFSYDVGPETYGRGIEVRFVDPKGQVLDSWQEFYAVAAEWFRVHQHTHAGANSLYGVTPWITYVNQMHYFAHEPTDLGVRTTDAEVYLSGQAGYQVNQAARKAQMDFYRAMGVKHTFYQTFAFCGQMGYEEMRRHPEYVLYDPSGQPAVDPIYGSFPNPMELASPLEVGPKRKADKPYLDRRYTPWQHCAANLAKEEVVLYQTHCIKKYAEEHGFDGVYIDGNMGVLKGYNEDGAPNVPSGKDEDFARLSARNHRLFSETLKKDNPNFGIWYNWGFHGFQWARSVGLTSMLGSGLKGDVGDENIRAAAAWKNVMILMETGSFLQSKEGWAARPAEFLEMLLAERDFAVQKWGANSIIGYSFIPWKEEEPGAAKWAWPTLNYVGAQLIATQTHHAGGFLPSYRPTLQFMTRYSRFLWAPDIRAVADEEKLVQVSSPEKLWWRRLVYRRQRADGYDLIVHLVRIPPTESWEYRWADEPAPLGGVRVTLAVGSGVLDRAWACRPYHFEEEQQVVQVPLQAKTHNGSAAIEAPPFRYHTMVVFRVKTR